MSRRRREAEVGSVDEEIMKVVAVLFVLWVGSLVYTYTTNRAKFWHDALMGFGLLFTVFIVILFVIYISDSGRAARIARAESELKRLNLEEKVKNFIRSYGKDKGKKDEVWKFHDYAIRNERLEYLRRGLAEGGLELSNYLLREILERILDKWAFEETKASMSVAPHPFASMTGTEFEQLLARLYEKMGYVVQLTGRAGDQGADLVAMKDGERLIIQAKRYAGSVGNAAIQEVAAAKNHYSGIAAVVATTSEFTREAIELAKTNEVQLIDKKSLQQLLMENLKENWN